MGGLRAVFAVLGAGAGLDRIEAGKLDRAVGVKTAMHLARLVDKLEQGLGQERQDLAFVPVVAEGSSRQRRLTGRLRRIFFAIDRIREGRKLGHVFVLRLLSGLAVR
jgi:hypothetical protein